MGDVVRVHLSEERRLHLAGVYSKVVGCAAVFGVPLTAAANRAIGLGLCSREDWDAAMAIVDAATGSAGE